jgi:predicted HicB family RNase H-like nuclease
MQAKLTLRLDKQLIEKAKRWAASRQISVSQAVEQFFAQIPDPDAPRHPPLSP